MGGSCISRPKKYRRNSDSYRQKHNKNGEQIKNIHSEFQVVVAEPFMFYPYFQPMWNLKIGPKKNIEVPIRSLKKKLNSLANQNISSENFLPSRFYSYSSSEAKRIFSQQPKQSANRQKQSKNVQQLTEAIMYKIPLLQSQVFGLIEAFRTQVSPQIEFLLLEKSSMHEFSEQTTATQNFSPQFLFISQGQQNQLVVRLLSGEQQIRKQLPQLNTCLKVTLNKNCLINGILLLKENIPKMSEGSLNESKLNTSQQFSKSALPQLLNSLNETKQTQNGDKLLCYINPLTKNTIKFKNKTSRLSNFQYNTYLQFKALVQDPEIDLTKTFKPQLILNAPKCELPSVYVLLFALKVFMQSHPQIKTIPLKFLNELITMKQSEYKILSKVINIIKLLYALAGCEGDTKHFNQSFETSIINCCRNILQITLVNSHLLIDAYLIEFSIEIDEKYLPIRQNPLLQSNQQIKCRYLVSIKPNIGLINAFKQLQIKFLPKIIEMSSNLENTQAISQNQSNDLQNLFADWTKEALQCIKKSLLDEKSVKTITFLLSHQQDANITSQDYTTDTVIASQYFLNIKIYKFICQSMQWSNLFQFPNYKQRKQKTNLVIKSWEDIIDQFTNNNYYNNCSGELAITILSLDGLVKMIENPNLVEQHQVIFTKALQIWHRIYRDPRAKYEPFISNKWIAFLIKTLIDLKSKNLPNPQNNQDILYLNNILDCFYSHRESASWGNPQSTQWIFSNLPIFNISGIYYKKIDMFLPPQDETTFSLLKTGSSLIDNQNDNLSSNSNFSDSVSNSNTNSDFTRIKKKSRRKILDFISLPESKALRNGVYQWGKGVNSVPLLYSLTKNLDVFKIACGNYHAVIASSAGIFGWGQNSSGQLGDSFNKQNVKGIKLILEKLIISENEVELSCGNQHTAILFKEKPLIMLGQQEGGIISGNGHMFDSVSCGGLHTLGIRKGKVYSWGRGQGGQLGHKTTFLKTKIKEQSTDFFLDEPKMIENLPSIKKSVCGDAHSILLTQNGEVYVFGFCYQGQLGLGLTGDSDVFQIFQPVRLEIKCYKDKSTKIADIFAGPTFSFFKTVEGDIFSCGLNDCNQLGQQKMLKVFHKKNFIQKQNNYKNYRVGEAEYSRPNKIQIFNNQIKVNKIYCGQNHCLASVQYMKKNKMIMGWGLNKQYQISNQFTPDNITPRTLDNIYDFNFNGICCGSTFSLGFIKNQNRLGIQELQFNIENVLKSTIKFHFQFSKP